MNWISSQSEQELRISMNKLEEGEEGIHGTGRWQGQQLGNSATHLPEPVSSSVKWGYYPPPLN